MKTYLLDTIERFKRYSQSLDVKTILCSKAWYVLSEDGDTENLIFQEDGTVLVSVNGSIKKYTWQYIPQNQSLNIMHSETDGTMLKPAFLDGKVLAFQKVGTKECMFLIDDSLDGQEKLLTLGSVKNYFIECEQKAIEQERKHALEILENERQCAAEKQRLKSMVGAYEQHCKALDDFYYNNDVDVYEACDGPYYEENGVGLFVILSAFVIMVLVVVLFQLFIPNIPDFVVGLGLMGGSIIGGIIGELFNKYFVFIFIQKRKLIKYIVKTKKSVKNVNYKYFEAMSNAYQEYQAKEKDLSEQETEINKLREQLREIKKQ